MYNSYRRDWPKSGRYTQVGYNAISKQLLCFYQNQQLISKFVLLKHVLIGETRVIRHYKLTCWPEQGVPDDTRKLTAFLQEVKMADSEGPALVHCSAGIGRTGVIIAVDVGKLNCLYTVYLRI